MTVALIDNGSLAPAAHRNLRRVAQVVSQRVGRTVHAVSWKHSDRIAPGQLEDTPAWTLASFVRSCHAAGERDFLFVPFFISPQGAIGSALRRDLEALRADLGPASFDFAFAQGLMERGVVPVIGADRIRAAITHRQLDRPAVIVVDHGGPSAESAAVRDELATCIRALLGEEIAALTAASMEGAHAPLLADILQTPDLAGRDIVVAPLFLSPGRHAGPGGDIARICGASPVLCHPAELIGTHPLAVDALSASLRDSLNTRPAPSFV